VDHKTEMEACLDEPFESRGRCLTSNSF